MWSKFLLLMSTMLHMSSSSKVPKLWQISVRSTEVVLLLLYYRNLFAAFVLSIHLSTFCYYCLVTIPDFFCHDVFQKVLWIGPVKIHKSSCTSGASKLAQILNQLSQSDCDVTVVGNMACEALINESSSFSVSNMVYNASVVWELLKGRKLSGVIALDRVCLIFMSISSFQITEINHASYPRFRVILAMAIARTIRSINCLKDIKISNIFAFFNGCRF